MKLSPRLLLLTALFFSLGISCASAAGQPGYGGQTITCSSDDGRRNYCSVPYGVNPNSVVMTRQISGSACIQYQTWGVDNRGLWVDRGCRAEFGFRGGNWGGGNQGQTLRCSSDDGGRSYCSIPPRSNATLAQQVSGSPCIQGQTWGVDNRGLWVDRGCRADFYINSGGGNWGGGGGNQGQSVTCSSDDGRRNYCNADVRGGIRLSRQISGSPCIQGQTWGWDNRGIWVDRGCRAEFITGNGGNWNGGGGAGVGQTFTCSSDNGRRNYCSIPNGVNPNNVTLSRQISGSPCVRGQTWGWDNRGLWVDRGCRAEFRSTY